MKLPPLPVPDGTLYGPDRSVKGHAYLAAAMRQYAMHAIAALEAQLADAEKENRRLTGHACLICGRDSPCDDAPDACTFDPHPIEAAQRFLTRARQAEAQLAEARAYATTLATSMHKQHYAEASPNWQPLPDLVGLLTQIDNMYAGLRNDLEALTVENKRLVGLPLAALLEERYALQIAWETAKKQNAHDMLLSGDEIHMHDAAINRARGAK